MESSPITSWQIVGKTMGTVTDFIFLGSKITADSDCSDEIKSCLLLGRKTMTNLDIILKSRDITLLIKVDIVKAIVFPVISDQDESWTWKKVECWITDAFEMCCWRRLQQDSWESLELQEITPVNPKGNQSWIFIEMTDAKAEAPILWPPYVKSHSLEKTLMPAKMEGRRRRGWQRMRLLDSTTESMNMSLSKFWDIMMEKPGMLQCMGLQSQTRLRD